MKLICIDIKNYTNITLYKLYDFIYIKTGAAWCPTDLYWIKDDSGNVRGIDRNCFITLEEWRNNKIESIL